MSEARSQRGRREWDHVCGRMCENWLTALSAAILSFVMSTGRLESPRLAAVSRLLTSPPSSCHRIFPTSLLLLLCFFFFLLFLLGLSTRGTLAARWAGAEVSHSRARADARRSAATAGEEQEDRSSGDGGSDGRRESKGQDGFSLSSGTSHARGPLVSCSRSCSQDQRSRSPSGRQPIRRPLS